MRFHDCNSKVEAGSPECQGSAGRQATGSEGSDLRDPRGALLHSKVAGRWRKDSAHSRFVTPLLEKMGFKGASSCLRMFQILWLLWIGLWGAGIPSTFAQSFPILDIRIRLDGRAVVTVAADADHYYLLYRGEVVTDIRRVVDVGVQAQSTVQLTDPEPLPLSESRFFRVEQAAVSAPRKGVRLQSPWEDRTKRIRLNVDEIKSVPMNARRKGFKALETADEASACYGHLPTNHHVR